MAKKQRIPHKFQPWIDARKKFRLSNAHIQMARELGLSPKRFGVYADRKDQPWKLPLGEFIETQYEKQFGKRRPDVVLSMEEIAAAHVAKRAARKAENAKSKQAASAAEPELKSEQVAVDDASASPEPPATDKVTESTTDRVTESTTDKVTEPATDKVTEPATDRVDESGPDGESNSGL